MLYSMLLQEKFSRVPPTEDILKDELFATHQADASYQGYLKHLEHDRGSTMN
ncbi:Hypothetical predicted protein [Paramuricea clavata]|uniref:Uncharacterized protein n=1 Tax=Paramuricea clavata TaxID=317549 RepID=A0A7D9HRX5_PARCT|nr:Hypothetical predicted protein [Paramuricea clavata]